MRRSLICLLLVCRAVPLWAVNPNNHISQYGHTAWRVQDGFLSGRPFAIAQTADGYLWIGGQNGLVRFDGARFVPWTPPPGKQLLSPAVAFLLAARDGSLWIGTALGLSHWINKDLVNYSSYANAAISSIIQDDGGTIWVTRVRITDGTGPLCQVKGTAMQCYGDADGIPDLGYTTLARDAAGNFWMGGDTGLTRWKPGSFKTYYARGLKSNVGNDGVVALVPRPGGSLWVGIDKRGPDLGLEQLLEGVWKPFVVPGFDSTTLNVYTLFLDRQNALWVGTDDQGIYRIYGRGVDHFGSSDGLSSDMISGFFEDREGNLFVATERGIDCFRDLQITSFSAREGLTTPAAASVLASRDGTVWIGGIDALDSIGQGHVSSVQAGKGLPGSQVTSLFEDHVGRKWVGIDNTLNIYENGRFTKITRRGGTPTGMVLGITEDVNGNIWVLSFGSPRTLIRISGRKAQEEIPTPQIPAATSLVAGHHGDIWLGLLNGDLARYERGRTQVFHFAHSADSRVTQLIANSDGSILGATGFGLIGWSDGKQQTLSARNGLPCDWVNAIVEDTTGALWLYMSCGLVEIEKSELEKWWAQPNVRFQPRVLDVLDGSQAGASTSSFESKAVRSLDGRLWFVSLSTLQMINPAHLTRNPIAPGVQVEQVIADRKSYSPQDNLRLPARTRDVEIDYTALSLSVPQKVRFRYKLGGRDTDWQDSGNRRQAFYTDLRPGTYRFRVIACNNDGVWNNDGATLNFNVAAAWYQTGWFRVSCVAGSMFLLWALYQLRLHQLARQFNIRLEERVGERTRIARELHDTLLQNLHGLMLQFQAAHNLFHKRPDEAMQTLDSAIDGTEQAITESQNAIEDLRSEPILQNDLAQSLTEMGKDLASSPDRTDSSPVLRITVEGERRNLSSEPQVEVYRIAREVLRNAFRYADAHHIEVEIRYDDQEFRLRIRDDGKGIAPKILEEGRRVGHWGLPGTRERAQRIGAKLDLWSKPGAGTEVQLTVPAALAYETSRPRFGLKLFRKAKTS